MQQRKDDILNSNELFSIDTSGIINNSLWIQAGSETGDGFRLSMVNATSRALGLKKTNISVMDEEKCEHAIKKISAAIDKVSTFRSMFGAQQNRLEHTINNLDNVVENTTSAEYRIRDTDMASEMVNYSKNNILAQAGQSMLAQANQSNQGVLSLLQ